MPTSSPRPKRVLEFLIHHCVFVKCIFKYKSKTKNLKMLTFNFFVSILIDYSWDLFEPLVGQILQDNLVGVPSHSTTHNLNLGFSKEKKNRRNHMIGTSHSLKCSRSLRRTSEIEIWGEIYLTIRVPQNSNHFEKPKTQPAPPLCSLIGLTI